MAITTLPSRELNQNISGAEKAAADSPVCMTDRGKRRNIADLLAMSGISETELEIPVRGERARPVDLA